MNSPAVPAARKQQELLSQKILDYHTQIERDKHTLKYLTLEMQFSFSAPDALRDALLQSKPSASSLSEFICEMLMDSMGLRMIGKHALLADFSDPIKISDISQLGVKPICGVYALIEKGVIIYIGSSRDIRIRILTHKSKGFSHFQFLKTRKRMHPIVEQKYISLIRPKFNSPATFDRTVSKDGRLYRYE